MLTVDGYNYSPLMHAAFNGHSQIVAELIRYNADIDLEDLNEHDSLNDSSRLDSSCSRKRTTTY